MVPIPEHLKQFKWYAEHLAWLVAKLFLVPHDPGDAEPRRAAFDNVNLDNLDLSDAYLKCADFIDSSCVNTNFRGAHLVNSCSKNTNFQGADFTDADMEDSDLHCAFQVKTVGLPEVPVVEDIDKKIWNRIKDFENGLYMSAWHTCRTTHCRGGWAIHLAGKEGYALEKRLGGIDSELAARLIYEKSRPGKACPDFYCSDEEAREDIERCALGT